MYSADIVSVVDVTGIPIIKRVADLGTNFLNDALQSLNLSEQQLVFFGVNTYATVVKQESKPPPKQVLTPGLDFNSTKGRYRFTRRSPSRTSN